MPLAESPAGKAFVQTKWTPGSKFLKERFIGYTDSNFTQKSAQPAWLGVQGPVMRAEVGDMIEILVYNVLEQPSITMHSMGLTYTKANEGSLYWNNSITTSQMAHVPIGNDIEPGSW